MKKFIAIPLLALGLAAPAEAGAVKVGVLACGIEGGFGYIIGSSKAIDCVFEPAGGGKRERYEGRIRKLGVDIGVTGRSVVVWAVFAPGRTRAGALDGYYGGVSAEATVAVGPGVNVLIGGYNKSINLEPVSIQGQSGLNVAAGIAGLRLDYVE